MNFFFCIWNHYFVVFFLLIAYYLLVHDSKLWIEIVSIERIEQVFRQFDKRFRRGATVFIADVQTLFVKKNNSKSYD